MHASFFFYTIIELIFHLKKYLLKNPVGQLEIEVSLVNEVITFEKLL